MKTEDEEENDSDDNDGKKDWEERKKLVHF